MALNFTGNPFFDDYNQEKGFLKLLFRPGYAVQARELTQMQDVLQNQISNFGSFVFKSGSQVLGGQITLDTNITYANLQPTYQNTAVNLVQFANTIITDAATSTIRASVIATIPQTTGSQNPPTLMIKYLTGSTFANGANVTVEGSNTGPFALLANTNSQGSGSVVSLREGVFFLDLDNLNPTQNTQANTVSSVVTNGYFVTVPTQTLVLNPYSNTPTAKIGLQISDLVITEQSDSSLLDPALGSTNYQAPGAARYQINAILSSRSFTSQDDTAFISLLTVNNGVTQSIQTVPVLSDLNDTLAQRTYDQSGDFVVNPFTITLSDSANNDTANANTQNYYAILNAGLAYVQGYRYQTVAKTVLSAPKARTIANTSEYKIQDYFGNYINVSNVNGEFNISSIPRVDIHCVAASTVATANSFVYANTLLGTAYVRAFEYVSSANTSNPSDLVFRTHLFHINTGSFISNTVSSTTNTIQFGPLFSSVANAYQGMTINIPSTGDQRLITQYVGSTQTATVDSNWSSAPGTGSEFVIIGNIQSAEAIGLSGSTNFNTANANIDISSKNTSNIYQYASLTDTNFQTLIFPFPNAPIASGLSQPNYQYRYKVASNQTLATGSPLTITLSVPNDPSATFTAAGVTGSDLIALSDFLVVQTTGKVIPMVAALGRSISTTSTTSTFTMGSSDGTIGSVDIFASVNSTIGAKTKTLVAPNVATAQTAGGVAVGSSNVYLNGGQVSFATPQSTNLVVPGNPQDIYISDVIDVVAIIDSGNTNVVVSNAMVQAAANNQSMPGNSVNITNNYTLFNGQKDTFYDHATLTLNPGAPVPKGQVLVLVSYYSPSVSGGYFSVDSYPNYTNIPSYSLTTAAASYNLRNCIDFRPVRDSATTNFTFTNFGSMLLPEPIPGDGFTVNFGYYLARTDKMILTRDGNFQIIQGTPSGSPTAPPTPPKAMLLYMLNVPAYTFYSANVFPQIESNKRYTMKDIGGLDKRISSLEYYTALNALEQQATNQTITDNNGLARPKNGILTDNFQGSSVADVSNPYYYASVDELKQQLRAPFTLNPVSLSFSESLSSGYQKSGKIYTLPYTTQSIITQTKASRIESLNPFGVTSWVGSMKLDPESDTWITTTQAPAVITNQTGAYDNWVAMGAPAYSTVWNNWQTIWSGTQSGPTTYQYSPSAYGNGGEDSGAPGVTYATTTTQTITDQIRTGVQTSVSWDTVLNYVGTKVINSSIIPYMRSNKLVFVARGMKPLTPVFSFFDSVNVSDYVVNASIITFTEPVTFQDTYQHCETIYDNDGGTNSGLGANSATVILSKGNIAYVRDVVGVVYPGKTFVGSISGNTAVVSSFQHLGGATDEQAGFLYQTLPFIEGTTPLANANTIVLAGSASNTDGYYTGNTISICSGDGLGSTSNIIAYNGASRIATVSPPWNIALSTPTTESFYYSIGASQTDNNGDITGLFIIPSTPDLEFATGTSVFQILDNPSANLAISTTKAQDSYTAQGTLEVTQQDFISTRVPVYSSQSVQQSQTVVGDPVTTSQVYNPVITQAAYDPYTSYNSEDPLAQIFTIDNNFYPNGVFITSVNLCFFSKDKNLPITLQIRPVVNGYPDSSTVIPFSEVTLLPEDITITYTPSMSDSNQYTTFNFDAPIHLLGGTQYSIVLLSNSNQYSIYTAAVGDKQLGTNSIISQPPYIGVFFKSQNSSTWTPFQGESMMFNINQAVFTTGTNGYLTFYSPKFVANIPFNIMTTSEYYADVLYMVNQDQVIKNTTATYAYRGTSNTSRTLDSSYTNVTPGQNYFLTARDVIEPIGNSFYLQTTINTSDQNVSPIIDQERYTLLSISNQINDGGITNNDIIITNAGEGYNIANTNLITVNGNGFGTGAQLQIGSLDPNGNILSVIVTPNGSGSGYANTISANISTSGYSPTSVASIAISNEVNPQGGNFIARYMTRMATLSPGMDAGDLQVGFSANKPLGTQIYVYYKILSAEDTTTFNNRPWVLMSLNGTDSFATSTGTLTDYAYVGSLDQYGNPTNKVGYGSYNTFRYFAVKIVMATNNPVNIPVISSLTVYAMPAA